MLGLVVLLGFRIFSGDGNIKSGPFSFGHGGRCRLGSNEEEDKYEEDGKLL